MRCLAVAWEPADLSGVQGERPGMGQGVAWHRSG